MSTWTCARCTDPDAVRMRNSALCQDCWRAIAEAGLKWCPRCQSGQPNVAGYCAPCRVQVDLARRSNPDYHERKRARQRAAAARRAGRAPESAPASIAPQEPAQRATGDVLGREGGYTYTANGAWVARSGRGREEPTWERMTNWGQALPAWRRCHAAPYTPIFDEVPVSAWRRHYPQEVL